MNYELFCSDCRTWTKHSAIEKKKYFLELKCLKCNHIIPYLVFPDKTCVDARLYDFIYKKLSPEKQEELDVMLYG